MLGVSSQRMHPRRLFRVFLYIRCVRFWGRSAEQSTVGIKRNRVFIEGIVFYLSFYQRDVFCPRLSHRKLSCHLAAQVSVFQASPQT